MFITWTMILKKKGPLMKKYKSFKRIFPSCSFSYINGKMQLENQSQFPSKSFNKSRNRASKKNKRITKKTLTLTLTPAISKKTIS